MSATTINDNINKSAIMMMILMMTTMLQHAWCNHVCLLYTMISLQYTFNEITPLCSRQYTRPHLSEKKASEAIERLLLPASAGPSRGNKNYCQLALARVPNGFTS